MRTDHMLKTHPRRGDIDVATLAACIDACVECGQTCTSCADACLGEDPVADFVRCIRLNLDCADICEATAHLLSRQTDAEAELLRRQVEVCAEACRACGAECERHAGHHEHCRVCADACRRCEEACGRLLSAVAA